MFHGKVKNTKGKGDSPSGAQASLCIKGLNESLKGVFAVRQNIFRGNLTAVEKEPGLPVASPINVGVSQLQSWRSSINKDGAEAIVELNEGQKRRADFGVADKDFSPSYDHLAAVNSCFASKFGHRRARLRHIPAAS